jgi:hypothetical protein
MPKILTGLQMLDPARRASISPIGSIFAGRKISALLADGLLRGPSAGVKLVTSEEPMPSLSL